MWILPNFYVMGGNWDVRKTGRIDRKGSTSQEVEVKLRNTRSMPFVALGICP